VDTEAEAVMMIVATADVAEDMEEAAAVRLRFSFHDYSKSYGLLPHFSFLVLVLFSTRRLRRRWIRRRLR